MMEQLSMFSTSRPWPQTYEEFETTCKLFLDEGELGDDLFTPSDTKTGRSYSVFGQKLVEMKLPTSKRSAQFKILFIEDDSSKKFITVKDDFTFDDFLNWLLENKRKIFRSLRPEIFSCCNFFTQCSDEGHCLYEKDRFYNGCLYRYNLESGKIFYGKNKNI